MERRLCSSWLVASCVIGVGDWQLGRGGFISWALAQSLGGGEPFEGRARWARGGLSRVRGSRIWGGAWGSDPRD